MNRFAARAVGKGRRMMAAGLNRRMADLALLEPCISFTFDDAPTSAFERGAAILGRAGARATYYVSLGLIDRETEVGPIGTTRHLQRAVEQGHEIGCHTFDHLDAWHVPACDYVASIDKNQRALEAVLPGYRLETFAYPKSGPTARVKGQALERFMACRGGGQEINADKIDLGLLRACFLDRRTGVDVVFASRLIDETVRRRGWLIFATHDIADAPSPYGVTPDLFQGVVDAAKASGARLLPVGEVAQMVRRSSVSTDSGAPVV